MQDHAPEEGMPRKYPGSSSNVLNWIKKKLAYSRGFAGACNILELDKGRSDRHTGH